MKMVGIRGKALSVVLVGCMSLTACGSSETMQPLAYCDAVAAAWDSTAIPNYDDDLSGAERDAAIGSMKTAIETLPQGVDLGAITQEQADLMVQVLPVYLALYEDPSLAGQDQAAAAEAVGLSAEEFESLNSPENNALAQAAVSSLTSYCQSSGN